VLGGGVVLIIHDFGYVPCQELIESIKQLSGVYICVCVYLQGGSNMSGTNCILFTHNQSRSYLNHLVFT
jgi:hypothetical protein